MCRPTNPIMSRFLSNQVKVACLLYDEVWLYMSTRLVAAIPITLIEDTINCSKSVSCCCLVGYHGQPSIIVCCSVYQIEENHQIGIILITKTVGLYKQYMLCSSIRNITIILQYQNLMLK